MDIALDASGDIDLSTGEARLVSGIDEIVQRLRIRFRTFLGEWFADQRIGFPWFQLVLVKRPNLALVRTYVRQLIITTPGVIAVSELRLTPAWGERSLVISFVARTTEGEISASQIGAPVPDSDYGMMVFDVDGNPLVVLLGG